MTLEVTVHPEPARHRFARDRTVRIGRAAGNDVQVGRQLLGGRSSVSKHHVHVAWDGTRWATLNVSDKTGLLRVYEPGNGCARARLLAPCNRPDADIYPADGHQS